MSEIAPQALFALVRWSHEAAVLQLFGASLFVVLVTPSRLAEDLVAPLRWLAVVCTTVAGVTAPLWLACVTASMAGDDSAAIDPAMLGTVLVGTSFGRFWLWHLGAIALLCALPLLPRLCGPRSRALAAGVALAGLGFVGHAMLPPGPLGWIHRLAQVVHLAAGGFWLGSLLPLIWVLRLSGRAASRQNCGTALRRFSEFGHVAVALVLGTGLVDTVLILGSVPADIGTNYRKLLAAKVGLVLLMVGLAVYNRYWIVPDLRRAPNRANACLRFNTAVGLGLGALVLAVTSLLGLTDPL